MELHHANPYYRSVKMGREGHTEGSHGGGGVAYGQELKSSPAISVSNSEFSRDSGFASQDHDFEQNQTTLYEVTYVS